MTAFTAVIARPFICLSIAHRCMRGCCTAPKGKTEVKAKKGFTTSVFCFKLIVGSPDQWVDDLSSFQRLSFFAGRSAVFCPAVWSCAGPCRLGPLYRQRAAFSYHRVPLEERYGSRNGGIPITLILVGAPYLSQQVYDILFVQDNVANFMHIVGGACGTVFGFAVRRK